MKGISHPSQSSLQPPSEPLPELWSPGPSCCQENRLPSLLWNLCVLGKGERGVCVHTCTQAQRSVARGCVSVHVTHSRVRRGALVFCVCWGGLDLLPLSVSTFQSQPGVCVRALSPTPQPAVQATGFPPLFLIPVSLGVRSLQATSVCRDGGRQEASSSSRLGTASPHPPHTPTPGECNKALAFLEAA